MQKTFASLLLALTVSLIGIAVAYAVGQRSGAQQIRNDVARSEERQREMVEQLRCDLAQGIAQQPEPVQTEPTEPSTDAAAEPPDEGTAPHSNDQPNPAPEPPAQAESTDANPAELLVEIAAAPPARAETEQEVEVPSEPSATPENAQPEEPPATPIAREAFDSVALGSSYAEVAQKFGRDGRTALTMEDASGAQTKQYLWQWAGPDGAACRVDMRFVDGVLTDKSYND